MPILVAMRDAMYPKMLSVWMFDPQKTPSRIFSIFDSSPI